MADIYAWNDWRLVRTLFDKLQKCLDDFKETAWEAEKFKMGVLDNPARLAELKKIIDIDPTWEEGMASIQTKYNEFKAIYDYLKEGE